MRTLTKKHLSVLKAISKDETQYVLNGVFVEETEDGLKATATDGRILAHVETKQAKETIEKAPLAKGIVPKELLTNAKKLEHAELVVDGENVSIKDSVGTLQAKAIKGHFPNYNQVIPQSSTFEIAFNASYLKSLAEIVQAFEDNKRATIRFSFRTALDPVKVVSETSDAKLTVVLIPVKV